METFTIGYLGKAMRKSVFVFLVFIHNLVFTALILLNSFSHSFENQILVSAIAITYWIAGWALLYRERESAEV
jgi:hypothetical protein